ncbi:MAG: hypothetical protein CVU19_06340 [Betaproteobacteria bacterium HGW-Betaproteobacteria-13]|nr:MAG: hypothetical protein CVU19_06340 [Betaproteobacteria bacterium HGW-Betaproteobacteria-13]
MIRRRFLQSLLMCAGASRVLTACAPPSEPLRFGANAWPGYAPLRLAEASGLISPERLRVLDFPNSSMVLSAFRNGTIDAAGLTLDEALALAASRQPLRIVLVFDVSDGADVIVLHSVEIVSMPLDRHESAFASGQVDALVTFEPVRSRLLDAGASELFSSREIPGEIVDVLVVREDVLRTRRADLQAAVSAHFEARLALLADPAAAAERLGARLSLDEAALRAALGLIQLPGPEENRRLLGGAEAGLAQVLVTMSSRMKSLGLLEGEPVLKGMLVADLVEAV